MVVTQSMLNAMASALAQETYIVPAFMAFSTSDTPAGLADTSLGGEIGDRVLMSLVKENNEVEYNALRTASSVVASTGDRLRIIGSATTETGGLLMTARTIPGIIHTTTFDIDATIKIRFE